MLGSMLHGYPSVPIASQKGEEKNGKRICQKKRKEMVLSILC